MHGVIGDGLLRGLGQQRFHQHLVAHHGEAALEDVGCAHALHFGFLRQQDHVGHVADEIFALGVTGDALRQVRADVFLSELEIALVDLHAVDLGNHRVGHLCACGERQGE